MSKTAKVYIWNFTMH